MISLRNRYIVFSLISLLFLAFTAHYLRSYPTSSTLKQEAPSTAKPAPTTPTYPKYKPEPSITTPAIIDNFPLAAAAHSSSDLPPIPSWNTPPSKHAEENTPLFIGFTRNWRLLQQVVVSYITAGWPASDIYVVENTGVMDSNAKGSLSLQNPFFLNYSRLGMLGVNVVRTPTLLTFAQLQNFYLHTSIERKWPIYFWSHMDVVAVSFEDHYAEAHPDSLAASADHSNFESIYAHCLKTLREANSLKKPDNRWAMRFFSYDRLTLVNVAAFIEVGGWDTMIPYYMTDCDMHSRLSMAEFGIKDVSVGMVFDVASSLDNLLVLYRKNGTGVEASFQDPNVIEEELRAAAGEGKRASEPRSESRRTAPPAQNMEKRANETGVEAWKEQALGALHSVADSITTIKGTKPKWEEDDINSEQFRHMVEVLDRMDVSKRESKNGRNTWQTRQRGGEGDPFYRDAKGFEDAIRMTIDHGRRVFAEKWGHRDCDIRDKGLMPNDAWKVEHDW